MSRHCFVEDEAIVEGPINLPRNWRHISNLRALSDEEQLVLGWYPYRKVMEPLPDGNHHREDQGMAIEPTEVVHTFAAIQTDIGTIKGRKRRSLRNASSSVVDKGQKEDMDEWAYQRQLELEGLTSRDDIEAFDDEYPSDPTFEGKYTSTVMMKQAEEFVAAEDHRAEVGASTIVSSGVRNLVDGWMEDSYPVVDNGGNAVMPPASFREYVRIPGEHSGQLVICREGDGLQVWFDGVGDMSDLRLLIHHTGGTLLHTLEFIEDDPGHWVTSSPDGTPGRFRYTLNFGADTLINQTTMNPGIELRISDMLRWGE